MIDRYHYRSWKYRSTLWLNHIESVRTFLSAWRVPEHLLIIGASGGYSLPLDWLKTFQTVTLVEPGFLSRKILEHRLYQIHGFSPQTVRVQAVALDFEKKHFLSSFNLENTGVLFSNVLGQIKIRSQARFFESLRVTLKDRSWASFHDRFSSDQVYWTTPDGILSEPVLTEKLIPPSTRLSKTHLDKTPTVQEHLASDALGRLHPKQVMYWDWQITPKQVHLIEGMINE